MNLPRCRVGEAFEVSPTQVLSCLELSVDLQTLLSPPTSTPPTPHQRQGRLERTSDGNLSLPPALPLSPLLPRCWAVGTPPAGDLLHLRRGWGGWGGGGIARSSVSNITHNLEVKDTGETWLSSPSPNHFSSSFSWLPVRLVWLLETRLRHLAACSSN